MKRQLVRRKTDGQLFKVIQGFILPQQEGRKKNVDASFLTLKNLDTQEEILYAYPYWANPEYTLVGTVEEDETLVNASESSIPNDELLKAMDVAANQESLFIGQNKKEDTCH